jgi:uncharacterized membrane protein
MNTSTPRLIAKAAGLTRYAGQPCIHGHHGERFVHNNGCVECKKLSKKNKRVYKKVGRPRKTELFIGPPKPKRVVFKPENDIDRWIVRSRSGNKAAQRKGLSVDMYKELIVTHCPLLGIELQYAKFEGNTPPDNYATLDKIDPKKGYVLGNVQIVSFRANTLKNSATLEELKMIIANWEKINT